MNACTDPDLLRIIKLCLTILDIAKIVIPIIIIVLGIIDLSKAVLAADETAQKQNTKLFIKRLIYGVAIFFVPLIVEVAIIQIGNVGGEGNYTDCIENLENIEYYEELAQTKKAQEQAEKLRKAEEIRLKLQEEETIKKNKVVTEQNKPSSNDGTFVGQKYNLAEYQLIGIARLCQREQGTAVGAAAEASLMANRFEIYGKSYGEGGNGLYNYVASSGWFASASSHMSSGYLSDEVLTAVKEVLVLGKRTLPLYVDEHDCIDCGSYGFDIRRIDVDGVSITSNSGLLNKSNYKQDKTVIHNRYGAVYTFYTFPTATSDPFGYTNYAKNKIDSLNGK